LTAVAFHVAEVFIVGKRQFIQVHYLRGADDLRKPGSPALLNSSKNPQEGFFTFAAHHMINAFGDVKRKGGSMRTARDNDRMWGPASDFSDRFAGK
jgi:hypothetical protein